MSGQGVRSRDGMTGIAQTGNGTLVSVFEQTELGTYAISSTNSFDNGKTWDNSTRLRVYTPSFHINPAALAGGPQITNVGGTLVASFHTSDDIPLNELNVLIRYSFKLVTSTDGRYM